MSTIWKNGKYQPLIRYVTNKDFKLLSNLVNIINGDSNTEGSFRKTIKDLIGGAPEAYDTLKEIADKLSKKANSTALNDYVLTTVLNEQVNTLNAAIDAKQPKGNYLTEHQSLEAYAKKSEIAEQIAAKADVTALTALEARIAALEAKHTETNTQIEA